jgi:hypothetical protein
MNTRKALFVLLLLLTFILAACAQTGDEAENISDSFIVPDVGADQTEADAAMLMDDEDSNMAKDEDIMSEKSGNMQEEQIEDYNEAVMDDDKEGMKGHEEAMIDETKEDLDGPDDGMEEMDEKHMIEGEDDMSEGSMSMTPDWFMKPLTAVDSGESFMIGDFEGKVVLVETLAMWCSNCLKQQGQVKILHELIGERDDFVSLGIDIDPNENADALLSYVNKHGFDWIYTVAPIEVSREIGQLYGDQFLNPPSTPMLIIDKDGEVHPLPFGIKSTENLLEALKPFMDGEM